jgi:hypothetical protein
MNTRYNTSFLLFVLVFVATPLQCHQEYFLRFSLHDITIQGITFALFTGEGS